MMYSGTRQHHRPYVVLLLRTVQFGQNATKKKRTKCHHPQWRECTTWNHRLHRGLSKQNNLYKTLHKRFLQATVNHHITWELGSLHISRCPQAQKLQLHHQEKWSRLLNPGRWTIQFLATSCRSRCFSWIIS